MNDFILATLPWRGFSLPAKQYLQIRKLQEPYSIEQIRQLINCTKFNNFLKNKPHWIRQSFIDLEKLKNIKASWALLGDKNYPEEFYQLKRPPLIITYKGAAYWQKKAKLSVVGSRNASSQSLNWLEHEFTELLRQKNILTISGGALGIDQKVHSISLKEKTHTLCLLPSGLDNIYPQRLQKWSDYFVNNGGCFMSEFSPMQKIFPSHFHSRNRLIAALAPINFIVEARRRSGSLLTAKWAIELNKTLCCLPSHPMDIGSQGSLDLISEGAQIIRNYKDLISLLDLHWSET